MGGGGTAPSFLPSALDGGEWSTLHPSGFASWKTAPNTHCIGGCVSLRASLDCLDAVE
jgi:hypothetical protein